MNISSKFKKAKRGQYFYETLSSTSQEPRLLRFMGLTHCAKVAYRDEVIFEVVGTLERIIVDADDRYGRYPPLSGPNLVKIRNQRNQLADDLAKYDFLLHQIHMKIDEIVKPTRA